MKIDLEPGDLEALATEYEQFRNMLRLREHMTHEEICAAGTSLLEELRVFLEGVEDQADIDLLPVEEDDT
jgi:hypothetical protein